jgi:hypothetical protein
MLIKFPGCGTHDETNLALGWGGAGRGKFVFAILDHSYDPANAYGWGDESENGNSELFRKLANRALKPHLVKAENTNALNNKVKLY